MALGPSEELTLEEELDDEELEDNSTLATLVAFVPSSVSAPPPLVQQQRAHPMTSPHHR